MGHEARATIRITVSVRPVFTVAKAYDGLKVATNVASGLRYSVVAEPLPTASGTGSQTAGTPGASVAVASARVAADRVRSLEDRLVLIVPD